MKEITPRPDAALLLNDVEEWVSQREELLLYTANELKNGGSIAKTLGLGGIAIGLILGGVNPLAPLAALLGGIGYLGAVLTDKAITNQFALMPFMRGDLSDKLATTFNADLRINVEKGSEIEELKRYLPSDEAFELVMLTTQKLKVIAHLEKVYPIEKRERNYFWQVKEFIAAVEGRKTYDIHSEVFTLENEDTEKPNEALPYLSPVSLNTSEVTTFTQPQDFTTSRGNSTPTFKPKDAPNMRTSALSILNELVEDADKSKLGGCVILAAPGAGKTTFLGTAWGRLKKTHGDNFKALAVVVKRSDVEAFNGVCECLCILDETEDVAKRIIEFIDESMTNKKVYRLFLDDYLTMQESLMSELSGVFIDKYGEILYSKPKGEKATPLIKKLNVALNTLWLVGREYNSALWVSSHSSNVEKLQFMGGSQSRSVGQMIFLARNDKRDFIFSPLGNATLIPEEKRRDDLRNLINRTQSNETEPLVLANFNNWTLGIVPAAVYEEYTQHRQDWLQSSPAVSPLQFKGLKMWLQQHQPDGLNKDDPALIEYLTAIKCPLSALDSLTD